MEPAPREGSGATTAHLAWTCGEGPGSAPRLHKSCTGSIKVGKLCCRTPLQWCHPRGLVDIRSDQQGFHHSIVRSALSEQRGSPSAPSLSQRHKSSTQMGNPAAATRISNCDSHPQILRDDRWQKRCSLQFCSLSSRALPSTSLGDSRCEIPEEYRPNCHLHLKSVRTNLQRLHSNRGTWSVCRACSFYNLYQLLQTKEFGLWHLLR